MALAKGARQRGARVVEHVRVLGAPHDARDPAGALGIAISGHVGVPDEDQGDIAGPLVHLERSAGVELGRDVVGVDVGRVERGVVYRAHTGSVLIIVESGEPGGQALDRCLEVGVQVNEGAKLLGQPFKSDLLLASARCQLLNAAIGEIHDLHSAL